MEHRGKRRRLSLANDKYRNAEALMAIIVL